MGLNYLYMWRHGKGHVMDNQEIFDKVVTHLRKQGGPALDKKGRCKYRAGNGRMCAVGCLIPDNLYHKDMEGKPVGCGFPIDSVLYEIGFGNSGLELLSCLQELHDRFNVGPTWPAGFEERLSEIANNFKLEYSHG